MRKIEVIGLGALNMDYLYRIESILEDGEAVVSEMVSAPGGSAANTIHGLSKLGVNTGFAGAVGDDAEGKKLLQDFSEVGVDTSQIILKPGARSGSVLCLSDQQAQRALYVTPGANNLLTMDDIDLPYVNRANMLHISSFADERQFEVTQQLISRLDPSVKISFSPGSLYATKGIKALSPILQQTYVLFANQSEIQELTGRHFDTGAKACLKAGCRIVVVTLGKGASYKTTLATSYIRDAENEYLVAPENQSIKPGLDTTGAGDAFATGFLYGLLTGKGIEECGHIGSVVAEFCINEVGARAGLPTLAELSQRYQDVYKQGL